MNTLLGLMLISCLVSYMLNEEHEHGTELLEAIWRNVQSLLGPGSPAVMPVRVESDTKAQKRIRHPRHTMEE
jgi:hypothetical protein